jgi:hypothetical protein
MLLRYEQMGKREVDFWAVTRPLDLEVVKGGEWERIGEVRKWTDVPLH